MMLLLFAAMMAELPEAQLQTIEGSRDVIPKAFRGRWADTTASCSDPDGLMQVEITDDRITAYESNSVLLKNSGLVMHGPSGTTIYTIMALLASSGEGEVAIGKVRLSRVGSQLHMSNAEAVSEEEHLTSRFAMVRCE